MILGQYYLYFVNGSFLVMEYNIILLGSLWLQDIKHVLILYMFLFKFILLMLFRIFVCSTVDCKFNRISITLNDLSFVTLAISLSLAKLLIYMLNLKNDDYECNAKASDGQDELIHSRAKAKNNRNYYIFYLLVSLQFFYFLLIAKRPLQYIIIPILVIAYVLIYIGNNVIYDSKFYTTHASKQKAKRLFFISSFCQITSTLFFIFCDNHLTERNMDFPFYRYLVLQFYTIVCGLFALTMNIGNTLLTNNEPEKTTEDNDPLQKSTQINEYKQEKHKHNTLKAVKMRRKKKKKKHSRDSGYVPEDAYKFAET